MLFRNTAIALLLVTAGSLAVAPTASACQPSPQCVVYGVADTVRDCTTGSSDCIVDRQVANAVDCATSAIACTFDYVGLGITLVQAYVTFAETVYCSNVGVGC